MSKSIETRRQAIWDMINQMGTVKFEQLEDMFPGVSGATLRKDLSYLSEQRRIVRFHGGAKRVPKEMGYESRSTLHRAEKSVVAAKAVDLIPPSSSVFITSGSTCAELARQMQVQPFYLATDGLDTALCLNYNPDVTVELLGGELNLNLMRVSGTPLLERLENLHFNIAFLGTPSFHPEQGFSYPSEATVTCFKKVIEHSDRVVMLMDSSKLNYAVTPFCVPLTDIDIIVTDDLLDEKIVEGLRKRGIEVL